MSRPHQLPLPLEVAVHQGPHLADPDALPDLEAQAVAHAVAARRHAFAAGRHYARAGLSQLGHVDAVIPKQDNRAPLWPEGFVGSIAHTSTWAIAVVALSDHFRSLGVDLEAIDRVTPEISERITTEDEQQYREDPELRAAIFSVKEAIYKAQHPLLGLRLGFRDVTLVLDPEQRKATTTVADLELTGYWTVQDGSIVSVVLV